MNINFYRMNDVVSDAAISKIKGLLKTVEDQMPFMIGLTAEERIRYPKISRSNKIFVEDVANAVEQHPAYVPNYLKKDALKKDLALYEKLDEVMMMLNVLSQKVRDTQILTGSEGYTQALSVYHAISAAADTGVPGADSLHSKLKKRFEPKPKNGNDSVAAEDQHGSDDLDNPDLMEDDNSNQIKKAG